ncbi:M1 family aminopeptidase [Blastococcus sp. CT_GayMR16]|uniref:M1 family aminopeptidase n=1 Tax=Blastococcus sp. CT_GayMR16 TaxID=2559607 RepID=UPI001073A1DC|nr:M1 family aminopeptidase [Blastococcus sp. CT_GayMR16]TFV88313.1 peptidase M1 [Blastococcus sp. CT_GayMR16]
MSAARRAAVAGAAVLLLGGCTSFADTVTTGTAPSAAPTTEAPDEVEAGGCPAERARPDPERPVVTLDYRLEDDLVTVTGTETVVFTPDRRVDELVFRLVPNGPDSAPAGNRLVVDDVRGDDVDAGRYEEAAAADPGGLYVVTLEDDLDAGDSTEVELDFTLTLGSRGFDRFGTDEGVSWWASGAPLLAWEPGVGWAEDPFVDLGGETTTSPAMDTSVSVSAPEALTVLMTGATAEPSPARDGRRTWTSTEPVARDVGVAAGLFTTERVTTPGGVAVTVGVLPDGELPAPQLAEWTSAAITHLEAHVGPFPYRTLTVALLPDYGGGIEYPSMIFEATPSRLVLVHEVAHMWFYGMVGNSQFRDPWLDEAFATWAEAVVDEQSAFGYQAALGMPGEVGGAMTDFPDDNTYFDVVYGKGGAALLAAREAAGPEAFDAAIRCYVDATAWSIATPGDVATALADLPGALAALTEAQALGKDDLPR